MIRTAENIRRWRESKGFVTPKTIYGDDGEQMLGKLMLVVTEVSEAAEAVRKADEENFREEIADTIIRLLDICATVGIDIEDEIAKKMEKNKQREFLHGSKVNL